MKLLSAYTLPTVLIVSLLISMLVLFAVSLYGFDHLYYMHYHRLMQQKEDVNSVYVLYANDSTLWQSAQKAGYFQLYEDDPQTAVTLDVKPWGLYESVAVRALDDRFFAVRLLANAQIGDTTQVDRTYLYLKDQYLKETEVIPDEGDSDYKAYYSFNDNERHFYLPDGLSRFSARGHAVLHGEDITLSSETKLVDVILIARKVTVESGFRGTLQIIATDTIILENYARLHYPSGIYLKGNSDRTFLYMGEHSRLHGYAVIFGATENESGEYQSTHFQQAATAILDGLLYVDRITQHYMRHTGQDRIGYPLFFRQYDYQRKELKTLN